MTIDTTITRDPATGEVTLTAEQAQELAEWALAPFAERNSMACDVVTACYQEPGDSPWDALTRWVLLNAPVVRAAEAQTAAGDDCLSQHVLRPYDVGAGRYAHRAWEDAAAATQAAVRAARRAAIEAELAADASQ